MPASSVRNSGLTNFNRFRSTRAGARQLPVVTGGTLTSDATHYYRTFTANGTLGVLGEGITADLYVVAGGGAGGGDVGGGGGGGQVRTLSQAVVPTGSHVVVVGAGGTNPSQVNGGFKGTDSSFAVSSALGGGGGQGRSGGTLATNDGFTGGGGSYNFTFLTGTTFRGGDSVNRGTASNGNGGGGGAGGVGLDGTGSKGGNGGPGLAVPTATGNVTYGGGGGGSYYQSSSSSVMGLGVDGGGNGGFDTTLGTNGAANRGGGGGGGPSFATGPNAGFGGSGIVIVRYARSQVE